MNGERLLNMSPLSSIDCYVALGANLGLPKHTLTQALEMLKAHPAIFSLKCSKFYETKPVSDLQQPNFLNAVCRFKCTLSLLELFSLLEEIEQKLGKVPKPKNAPRIIDLDLIFYGDTVYRSAKLTVPHPRWKERIFVLQPLADVLC